MIQASHDVKKITNSELKTHPTLRNLEMYYFGKQGFIRLIGVKKKAIIQRVLERGNETEIRELISFYGKVTITEEIKSIKNDRFPSFEQNVLKYNLR